MPVIKSAKKKLKQDRKREKANLHVKEGYRKALKDAQKTKSSEKVRIAVKLIDKAAKKGIVHKNKAARLKSKLAKIAKSVSKKTSHEKTVKKSSKSKK